MMGTLDSTLSPSFTDIEVMFSASDTVGSGFPLQNSYYDNGYLHWWGREVNQMPSSSVRTNSCDIRCVEAL